MRPKHKPIIAKNKDGRLLEIFIFSKRILISERKGKGQIEKLTKNLTKYGLNLEKEFNSPCG